jgi:predicted esterase YcpF (UPF0227 family)
MSQERHRILYLHGFLSSPGSFKARLMRDALAGRGLESIWACPQLPASPKAAAALILETAQAQLAAPAGPDGNPLMLTVIGSSLGGYYANWLAEQLACRAVLLNPAVDAARDLAQAVGEHRTFHTNEPFMFLPEYARELADLRTGPPTRLERYFLIAATGDEVLDWREMRDRYAGCRQRVIEGGDHGLSGFASWLPEVLEFAFADAATHPHPGPPLEGEGASASRRRYS